MTQNLQPMTYEMIFIFSGIAWAGLMLFALAVYIGISRIRTPKPDNRWEQEWQRIEEDMSK